MQCCLNLFPCKLGVVLLLVKTGKACASWVVGGCCVLVIQRTGSFVHWLVSEIAASSRAESDRSRRDKKTHATAQERDDKRPKTFGRWDARSLQGHAILCFKKVSILRCHHVQAGFESSDAAFGCASATAGRAQAPGLPLLPSAENLLNTRNL